MASIPSGNNGQSAKLLLAFPIFPSKKTAVATGFAPSDDINVIEFSTSVEIYLLCGENATGLSDCILCFSGTLKESPKYDEHTWSITIVDQSISLLTRQLPLATVGSVYSDAPGDYLNDAIPLVYGIFNWDDLSSDVGLVKGIPINTDTPPKCVFADHVLNAFTTMFYQESGLTEPSFYNSVTLNVNDGGRGTGVPLSSELTIYLIPDNRSYEGYTFPYLAAQQPDYPNKAYDRDQNTYCESWDGFDNGTTMYSNATFGFGPERDIAIEGVFYKAIEQSGGNWGLRYKIGPSSGITFGTQEVRICWNYVGSTLYSEDFAATFDNTWRNTGTANHDGPLMSDRLKYCLLVLASSTSGADSVINNKHIAKIYEIRLRIIYKEAAAMIGWGALQGREFGSWIDSAGHLVDDQGYDAGDLIEDPAYIIESLLRDELSWATASIDEASFDDAANSSVIMRMNLTKKATAARIIRQICEQSTFAFHMSGAGKAKLIPLNESSPSTDRTIPFSHVKANSLRMSQVGPFVNWLTYNSCWLPQLGKYRNINTNYDVGSASSYGVHEHTVYWPNIEGTSVTHIFQHLISATGLWSEPKNVIEFEAIGFTNADIEIGDWIELDDETWDAQLQLNGASWSGEQFLVTEVTQKQDGTRIKAIAI